MGSIDFVCAKSTEERPSRTLGHELDERETSAEQQKSPAMALRVPQSLEDLRVENDGIRTHTSNEQVRRSRGGGGGEDE